MARIEFVVRYEAEADAKLDIFGPQAGGIIVDSTQGHSKKSNADTEETIQNSHMIGIAIHTPAPL